MIDIVKGLYSPITDLYDRIGKWKQLHNDLATKSRLLYLECSRNLALLKTVNLGGSNSEVKVDDADFVALATHLETDILEMIFFEGEENNKFFKMLLEKIEIPINDKSKKAKEPDTPKTLIQACVSLYVSIYTLQKICQMPRKGKSLKRVNFRTRLRNIRNNYLAIIQVLSQQKEVKSILRTSPI